VGTVSFASTVDGISRRTGVAKTTIYRHWPSREHLVLAVIAEIAFEIPRPGTGDPLRDIRAILVATWEAMSEPTQRNALASLTESSAFDDGLDSIHRAFLDDRAAPLVEALSRAVESGLVEPDMGAASPGDLLALLVAPILLRAFIRGESVDHVFVDHLVQLVLRPNATPTTSPRRARRNL
jgi:AcrR family transcriptional regulator